MGLSDDRRDTQNLFLRNSFFDTGTAYTARILESDLVPGYGDCSQFPVSWTWGKCSGICIVESLNAVDRSG